MAAIEFGERCFARRRGEEALFVAHEEIAIIGEPFERGAALAGEARKTILRLGDASRESGVEDWPIAGAAAEIASELVADRRAARPFVRLVERKEAHHDARRAEAALRAMQVDHRLLDRMEVFAFGKVLDSDDFGAVDLAKQHDAGVDRLVVHAAAWARPRQHDSA